FFATKSVSEFSSISAPSLAATRPSAVARSARLPTSLAPLMRSSSTALSKSPSDSSSAFLQSIMPEPVSSRSRLTSAAVKLDMTLSRFGLGQACAGGGGGVAASSAGLAPSSSSRSHSASGSSPATTPGSGFVSVRVARPERAISPSATASATTRVSSAAERIASSLPGIGKSTSSGSQLVSSTAITGMPSLRASSTAMCSFLVSTTQMADGLGELVLLAGELQGLLLGVPGGGAAQVAQSLELLHPLQTLVDRLE